MSRVVEDDDELKVEDRCGRCGRASEVYYNHRARRDLCLVCNRKEVRLEDRERARQERTQRVVGGVLAAALGLWALYGMVNSDDSSGEEREQCFYDRAPYEC